jgi:hypothetical protein
VSGCEGSFRGEEDSVEVESSLLEESKFLQLYQHCCVQCSQRNLTTRLSYPISISKISNQHLHVQGNLPFAHCEQILLLKLFSASFSPQIVSLLLLLFEVDEARENEGKLET